MCPELELLDHMEMNYFLVFPVYLCWYVTIQLKTQLLKTRIHNSLVR
jgi:hypothetical protein